MTRLAALACLTAALLLGACSREEFNLGLHQATNSYTTNPKAFYKDGDVGVSDLFESERDRLNAYESVHRCWGQNTHRRQATMNGVNDTYEMTGCTRVPSYSYPDRFKGR
jgi:hypothetical protein